MADKVPPEKTITHKNFKEPFQAGQDVLINPEIRASTPVYPIDRADYFILTNFVSGFSEWATRMLILSVGIAIPLLSKSAAARLNGIPSGISEWEYGSLFLALLLSMLLYILGHFLPNNRTKLLKKMKAHFDSATTRIESRRR